MNKQSFFTGFSRNIIIVGFVSLFTDLSSQMVFPVVPLFLLSLGASAWVIGLVEGAAETTASLLKVFSGYWSDKIKRRKPFVFAGYGLSSLTKPLFAFAQTWPFVLFFRVIERVGKGIRDAPRDAIVAESVDVSIRGKVYGLQRAMDGVGSFLARYYRSLVHPIYQRKTATKYTAERSINAFSYKHKKTPPQSSDIHLRFYHIFLCEFRDRIPYVKGKIYRFFR